MCLWRFVIAGAALWKDMTLVQKAPWKRLGEEAARMYKAEKDLQDSQVIRYSLTSAGIAAASRIKKKAISTAKASKTKTKAPMKSAVKKGTRKIAGKVLKKVTIKKRPAIKHKVCFSSSTVTDFSQQYKSYHFVLDIKLVLNLVVLGTNLYLDLDLVPPVLSRTLGDELSPSGTIVGSISRITPVNTQCVQIFFQCVLPCPPWSSDPPSSCHLLVSILRPDWLVVLLQSSLIFR